MSKIKEIKTWYGETDIATLVNYAGVWVDQNNNVYPESKMFDKNPSSIWQSAKEYQQEVKIIGVEFKVILFSLKLSILPNDQPS